MKKFDTDGAISYPSDTEPLRKEMEKVLNEDGRWDKVEKVRDYLANFVGVDGWPARPKVGNRAAKRKKPSKRSRKK